MLSCFFSILISASLFATLSVSSLISASFVLIASSFSLSSNSVSISIVSCSAKHSNNRRALAVHSHSVRRLVSINAYSDMDAAMPV